MKKNYGLIYSRFINQSAYFSSMKKAFTLIELLIVVAILAILAIGVLAAIDPIEQFSKGQDTTLVNMAAEYKSALDRYYVANSTYPTSLTGVATSVLSSGAGSNSVTALMNSGELKSSFTSNSQMLANLIVVISSANAVPVVCTNLLQSRTFNYNSSARYATNGTSMPAATCPTSAKTTCAICFF